MQIFAEATESSGDNNIEKERGGKHDMGIFPLLLVLFYDAGFLLLLFDATVC